MERLRAPLRSGGGAAGARSAPGRRPLAGGLVWRPVGSPNRRPPRGRSESSSARREVGTQRKRAPPGEAPSYRAAQPGPANLCLGAAGCPRHRRAPLRSGGGAAGARSAPGRRPLAGGLVWRPFGPPNRRPPVDAAACAARTCAAAPPDWESKAAAFRYTKAALQRSCFHWP